MSGSSRLNLDNQLYRNDETRNNEDFEDGDFAALKPNYGRRAGAHHSVTRHEAPHNSVPEFLTGRIKTQNNQLPHHFTPSQNIATIILPDNNLPMAEQTPQRKNSDSGNPSNKLAGAIVGVASQQQPQTLSAIIKPTTTNTLIFDG